MPRAVIFGTPVGAPRKAAGLRLEFVFEHLRCVPEHLQVKFAPDEFIDERRDSLLVRDGLRVRTHPAAFAEHFTHGKQAVPQIL